MNPEEIKALSEELEQLRSWPAAKAMARLAEMEAASPDNVLILYPDFIADLPYAAGVLESALRHAAEKEPKAVLAFFALAFDASYAQPPYKEEVLERAARNAAETSPKALWHFSVAIAGRPYAQEVLLRSVHTGMQASPGGALAQLKRLPHTDALLEQVVEKALEKEPGAVTLNYALIKGKPYAEKALDRDIWNIKDTYPAIIVRHYPLIKDKPYAKAMLKDAMHAAMSTHPSTVLQRLPDIYGEPYAKEILKQIWPKLPPLELAAHLNREHGRPDHVRFAVLEYASANDLFGLIGKARAEMFTSTFNGTFDRMMARLTAQGATVLDLLEDRKNKELLPAFVEAAAEYGRIGHVFASLPDDAARSQLLDYLLGASTDKIASAAATGVAETSTLLRPAIALADTMRALESPVLRAQFETKLMEHYQHAQGNSQKALGLVISSYLKDASPQLPALFANEDFRRRYPLPDIGILPASGLFDAQGRHVQQMFFYADEDGKASFRNMLALYKKDTPDYTIRDHGGFVEISATRTGPDGQPRHFLLVANKPDDDKERPAVAMIADKPEKTPQERNVEQASAYLQSIGAVPSIIIHRGHSYHTDQTMKHITPETKAVFWGSCGGYQNIAATLEIAPDAQILSTKGTGSRSVNDPLFKQISEDILNYGTVSWAQAWDAGRLKGQGVDWQLFKQYVRPDQNKAAAFVMAYRKLEDTGPTAVAPSLPVHVPTDDLHEGFHVPPPFIPVPQSPTPIGPMPRP